MIGSSRGRAAVSRILAEVATIVAMLVLAFAPLLPMAPARSADADAAYALPDGSIPVICYGSGPTAPDDDGDHGPLCPLCTIVKAFGMPPVEAFPTPVPVAYAVILPAPELPAPPGGIPAAHRARAPPVAA